MKFSMLIVTIFLFSSCGQIQRIMDGTEKLPEKMDKMGNSMEVVNDATRLAVISGAEDKLFAKENRKNLVPIPFDMMPSAKILAGALTATETALFFKNFITKLNTQTSADVVPPMDEEVFQHERMADYYMLMLVAGFLPEKTVNELISAQSNQGGYQQEMFAILKLRADFNGDLMLMMSLLGLNPLEVDEHGNNKVIDEKKKLDSLGKIENAIAYNEKVAMICNLDFADKIDLQIEGFKLAPLDKEKAKKYWAIIKARSESDFKASSLSKDPAKNEQEVKDYAARYKTLLDKLQTKIDGK